MKTFSDIENVKTERQLKSQIRNDSVLLKKEARFFIKNTLNLDMTNSCRVLPVASSAI